MATKKKTVKKATKKKPELDLYKLACDVEEVVMKIDRVKELLALLGESWSQESWYSPRPSLVALGEDLLSAEMNKLETMSNQIMDIYKGASK